jgi:TRAP-type C4-dicarboxylate transport system permease small subunit
MTERILAPIAAFCLFAMMAITFVDVIARYFVGSPLSGGEEVKAYLLGFTIFAAIPLVTHRQRHIAVRTLASALQGRALYAQRAVVLAGTVAGFGFIGVVLYLQADTLREAGELTAYLDLPLAPPVYVFAALSWVAALMALDGLVRHLRGLTAEPDAAAGPE